MLDLLRKLIGGRERKDKRRCRRYTADGLLLVNTADGRVHRGRLRDLSETGVGAIIYGILEVGCSVELRYEDPRGVRQVRRAVVRHHYGYKHGFDFV
jgi:PilZ domain